MLRAVLAVEREVAAVEMVRKLLAVRKRVLGAEHPGTLTTANNLARSLSRQGKHAEAEEMRREVLAVRKRVQGAEHPDVLTVASNLAIPLSSQGKHAEAGGDAARCAGGGEAGAGGGASLNLVLVPSSQSPRGQAPLKLASARENE